MKDIYDYLHGKGVIGYTSKPASAIHFCAKALASSSFSG